VTYGDGGQAMARSYTLLTGAGTRVTRPLRFMREVARRPRTFLKTLVPGDWSRRTIILVVMQTLDNAIRLRPIPRRRGGVRLQTEQDPDRPNPTYIEAANDAARRLAQKTGGYAQSSIAEALANIPTTAHILGGAVLGTDRDQAVVDVEGRIFGYERLLVTDGSAIPANPGVNPSLTITAMAERTLSKVQPRSGGGVVEPVRTTWTVPSLSRGAV
jgi:cholesterol oxidase